MPSTPKPTKARKPKGARKEQFKQFGQAFKITASRDSRLIPLVIVAFVGVAVVVELIALALGHPLLYLVFAVLFGLLAAMVVFGNRARRAAMLQMEGQPGAAPSVLKNMRGNWHTTESVAGNTQMDLVHRVVGKPGVILIGEGAPHRVRGLLAQEKKRVARISGQTPIYDIIVGNDEGQVPLKKLSSHLLRLPPNIRDAKQINALDTRLATLSSPRAAMPKGPMPAKAQRGVSARTMRRR